MTAAIRYLVDELDPAVAFYVDRLGFRLHENWGAVVVLRRDDLELWVSGPESSAAGYSARGNRFVLDVPDLDRALADLAAVSEIVQSPSGRWATVTDPAGNLIELFERS